MVLGEMKVVNDPQVDFITLYQNDGTSITVPLSQIALVIQWLKSFL